MNNSVLLQVDESTKGLMEEIQSGITSSIEDGMRELKEKVESVDDNTDMILRKFTNFDSLSSTVEQLRLLAEESKKFASVVSPLQNSVCEIREGSKSIEQNIERIASNISLLINGVVEVGDKQAASSAELADKIQNILSSLMVEDEYIKRTLSEVLHNQVCADVSRKELFLQISTTLAGLKKSIEELGRYFTENFDRMEAVLVRLCASQDNLEKRYDTNESAHREFESQTIAQLQNVSESLEKVQATLGIVVNLVTPFWKKIVK